MNENTYYAQGRSVRYMHADQTSVWICDASADVDPFWVAAAMNEKQTRDWSARNGARRETLELAIETEEPANGNLF